MRMFNLRMLSLASWLVVGMACGDSGEAEPPTDDSADDDGSDSGDESADSSGGDESDTGPPNECEGADGCYDCPPTEPVHYINGCTDATCEPFANTPERLPLLEADGSLPPLP